MPTAIPSSTGIPTIPFPCTTGDASAVPSGLPMTPVAMRPDTEPVGPAPGPRKPSNEDGALGQAMETLGDTIDAAVDLGSSVTATAAEPSVLDTVGDALSAAGDLLSGVGDTLGTAGDALGDVLSGVGDALGAAGDLLGSLFD